MTWIDISNRWARLNFQQRRRVIGVKTRDVSQLMFRRLSCEEMKIVLLYYSNDRKPKQAIPAWA